MFTHRDDLIWDPPAVHAHWQACAARAAAAMAINKHESNTSGPGWERRMDTCEAAQCTRAYVRAGRRRWLWDELSKSELMPPTCGKSRYASGERHSPSPFLSLCSFARFFLPLLQSQAWMGTGCRSCLHPPLQASLHWGKSDSWPGSLPSGRTRSASFSAAAACQTKNWWKHFIFDLWSSLWSCSKRAGHLRSSTMTF